MTDYKAGGRPQAGLQAEGRRKREEGAGRILPDQEFSLGRTSHLAPRTGMCPTCWGGRKEERWLCASQASDTRIPLATRTPGPGCPSWIPPPKWIFSKL